MADRLTPAERLQLTAAYHAVQASIAKTEYAIVSAETERCEALELIQELEERLSQYYAMPFDGDLGAISRADGDAGRLQWMKQKYHNALDALSTCQQTISELKAQRDVMFPSELVAAILDRRP